MNPESTNLEGSTSRLEDMQWKDPAKVEDGQGKKRVY